MPQSLSKVNIHLIFSTKDRVPCLAKNHQSALHAYLGGVLHETGCYPIQIGGVEDHVHLLFVLSRTITIAKLVETVKTSSSKWLKTKDGSHLNFHWQSGYGAFSVGEDSVPAVTHYVASQTEHHAKHTFKDEFREHLSRFKIGYDENYVWD